MALEITFTLPYNQFEKTHKPRAHIFFEKNPFLRLICIAHPTDNTLMELQRTVYVTESFFLLNENERKKTFSFSLSPRNGAF